MGRYGNEEWEYDHWARTQALLISEAFTGDGDKVCLTLVLYISTYHIIVVGSNLESMYISFMNYSKYDRQLVHPRQ